MSHRSPLGNNYGWVTTKDHHYASRNLSEAQHDVLAVSAVVQDPDLSKIEKALGFPVILAVKLGVRTIHVRVYKRVDVEKRPDNLASRMAQRDDAAFMTFNSNGGLELVEGQLRHQAQGHTPLYYADRVFSPKQVDALDRMQALYTGTIRTKIGLPQAAAPLEEEWVEDDAVEPPTLEPAPINSR